MHLVPRPSKTQNFPSQHVVLQSAFATQFEPNGTLPGANGSCGTATGAGSATATGTANTVGRRAITVGQYATTAV